MISGLNRDGALAPGRKTLGGIFSLGRNIISFGGRSTKSYRGGEKRKADADKAGRSPHRAFFDPAKNNDS